MFNSLLGVQRDIVFHKSGKFVVRACPGSGKTYCVAARLARLMSDWREGYAGVAALSFTNVAWQEIEKKLTEEFVKGQKIVHPHFIGTIDSFINKYIFLPYGHLILGCEQRPILVGEPHGTWSGGSYERDPNGFFDKVSFDINKNLIPVSSLQVFPFSWKKNQDGSINGHVKKLKISKVALMKRGFATQSDANFIAMRVLEKFPQIARAISLRFPYLIVDEAQDTSEIQMRIIDLLVEQGLSEVMLVGDPDQAIFEWNDARPDLLNQKFNEWNNSIVLNESRRSSQIICNFTFGLSSLATPSVSVNEDVKNIAHPPAVILYESEQNLPQIVEAFINNCKQCGINVSAETTAVIYRANSIASSVSGIPSTSFTKSPWISTDTYSREFARGKFLYDSGHLTEGFKIIEKALLKQINNLVFCSDEYLKERIDELGYVELKTLIFDFIKMLPKTDMSVGSWIAATNKVLKENDLDFNLGVTSEATDCTFQQVFVRESEKKQERSYRLGTVYSVKGETFDAVLLILKSKGVGRAYKTLLNQNIPNSESEELRVAYVGMTRPRKLLMIAVPKIADKKAWEARLALE
jgi:DNA helicase-2/ATP-dependent DNA helicase PcrA